MNVLLTRIDVHSSSIVHFQWSHCGLSMASAYIYGLLLMDVNARVVAMMISAFSEILTRLLVMRFIRGGWQDCVVMAAVQRALPSSRRR